jgi:hypothetical protein
MLVDVLKSNVLFITVTISYTPVYMYSRETTGRLPAPSDVAAVTQLAQSMLAANGVSLSGTEEVAVAVAAGACLSSWGQSLPVCSILGEWGARPRCDFLCCAVLCCAVLCCDVMCCVVM